MKEKNISILQGVCATVIFLSYFLPWVDTPFGDFSLAEGAYEMAKSSRELILLSGLFVVFLAGVNVLFQWLLKAPIGAFYFNLLPLGICSTVIFGLDAFSMWKLSMDYVGMGFWGAFLAGLVSCVDAWTTMGKHYYVRYRPFMIMASAFTVVCFVVSMVTHTEPESLLFSAHTPDDKWVAWTFIISYLLFIIHLPFVIYGWIVFGITREQQLWWLEHDSKQKSLQAGLDSAHAENQGADSAQESPRADVAPSRPSVQQEAPVVQPVLQEERPKVETVRQAEECTLRPQVAPVPPKPSRKLSKRSMLIIVGSGAGVLVLAGLILGYFFWYVPYAKDRDALRTYVVADNLFFRSSKVAGVEYNVLSQLHYGAELITYSQDAEWAEVKADDTEGFVFSDYLLPWEDFKLLNDVWGSADAKAYIESTKCRLALVDYCKRNQLLTGSEAWQLHTLQKDVKPNNVLFPRLNNGYDKFTEFAFILKHNMTKERRLAIYSFDEETEEPIFLYEEAAPEDGQIRQIRLSGNRFMVSYSR